MVHMSSVAGQGGERQEGRLEINIFRGNLISAGSGKYLI